MYCTSKISQVRLTGCLVFYDILCAAIFQLLNALQFFQGVFQFMKPQSKKNLVFGKYTIYTKHVLQL